MLRCSKHFYSEEENSATIYHLSVCMKMDPDEATKVVIEKLAMLEPEHVVKRIMGYIYFQGITAEAMIRLAMGPDHLIHELIQCAKSARLLASPPPMKPMNPTPLPNPTCQFTPFNPERIYPMVHPYFDHQPHQMHQPNPSPKMVPHYDYISLEDPVDSNVISSKDYYHTEAPLHHLKVGRSPPPSVMGFPVKTCHYFNRGYCKHGSNCRYLHVESSPEGFENIAGDMAGGDQVISPGSLQKLEFEIVHLLKSRRGNPVSIASLPMLYYEKYDKTLQAEGYLTESKRHGKAGYSLTKLLVRLKNSIRLIDRPHGQHAVVLAEDALKYMDIHSGRNEPGHVVPGSRQIYLTFPADSTFTEDDVSRYFNTFGPVQDVRIPCQMKRMFGFVTFASADTVKLILSKGNPHYVCNARVLVKPYREKAKLVERKYLEKFDRSVYCNPHPVNMESGLQPNWQSSRLFQRHQQQLMQEHEQALELEAMHLAHLQLPCKPVPDHQCFGYSMPDLKVTQDQQPDFLSTKDFNFLVDDVLNSPGLDSLKLSVDNGSDDESSIGLNLPDSPFAAAVASSIAAIL